MATNSVGERVRLLRKKQGWTQDELANRCGYASKTTITKLENGQRSASEKVVETLARALNTTPAYLFGGEEHVDGELLCVRYPVLGDVAAGFNWMAEVEDTGDYEYIPREWLRRQDPKNYFVLRVRGDSMYPTYQDGDRVLVRRLPSVPSGATAVVIFDSDYATLKKVNYRKGQDWLELIPINPEYAPKVIEGADLERCRVCGEVIMTIRDNV